MVRRCIGSFTGTTTNGGPVGHQRRKFAVVLVFKALALSGGDARCRPNTWNPALVAFDDTHAP